VTAPQTGALPPPPPDVGKFTVQVGATQDRVEARQMVVLASKGGLRPYVAEARLAGRGLWYRVRLGAFADRAAADQYRRDVERELHMPALVMPTR
jgi:cell division septation protein DedD